MEKIKSINAYDKEGKQFVVISTNDGKSYVVNMALVEYAIKHIRKVGAK